MSELSFAHSFMAACLFSFVSNATNFFIHSLKRFVLKKTFYFEYVILSILNLHVYLFYLFGVFSSIKEKKQVSKENLKKCTSFEEQKSTTYIWENVCFGIIVFSCLSTTKLCLRFLLICFIWEIKGFYQRSLGSKVDFMNIMNVSPNILAKN